MSNKKIYTCPNCGSDHFTVSFTGIYNATLEEEDGNLYGERELHAFDGSDNEIHCAECCKTITKNISW